MEYTMNGREPERDGNRDPLIAPHGVFPSKIDSRIPAS